MINKKNTKHTKWSILSLIIPVILILILSSALFARVGGAGGGGGGGGSGDGIAGLVIYLLMRIPFPYNIIIAAIVIAVYYYSQKKAKEQSILNKLPDGASQKKVKGFQEFLVQNPDFNEEEFKGKVKKAFIELQEAWTKMDISKIRKYISDGVYQRLNTQFEMMKLLEQKNTISDIKIKNIYIARSYTDGLFDIIDVGIHAQMNDIFESAKYPSLNDYTGNEEFIEFWSFIKKRNSNSKDLYNSDNCPSCGAVLSPEMGEVSKCKYCGSVTNTGEYDWILSEIT
ncbi:MAG: transporter, partial [Actinomycetia bacterium]|nr:transporter [Actinomycetes bacterium]